MFDGAKQRLRVIIKKVIGAQLIVGLIVWRIHEILGKQLLKN